MTERTLSSGAVVWITGLPQSGKSTMARRIRARLDRASCILDSDEIRDALVPKLGFEPPQRDDFYATLANLAAVLCGQGLIVIVAATANLSAYRAHARSLAARFLEVHVDATVETCAQRDQKGLYARHGLALPGRGAVYEPPADADVTASGGHDDQALERLLELLPG